MQINEKYQVTVLSTSFLEETKAAVTKSSPKGDQTYSPQRLVSTVKSEVYLYPLNLCAIARYYHLGTHAITMV